MFRFLAIVAALGLAIYKTLYGVKQPIITVVPQTTDQPVLGQVTLPPKPVVVLGEPLTDEEWEWLSSSRLSRDVN